MLVTGTASDIWYIQPKGVRKPVCCKDAFRTQTHFQKISTLLSPVNQDVVSMQTIWRQGTARSLPVCPHCHGPPLPALGTSARRTRHRSRWRPLGSSSSWPGSWLHPPAKKDCGRPIPTPAFAVPFCRFTLCQREKLRMQIGDMTIKHNKTTGLMLVYRMFNDTCESMDWKQSNSPLINRPRGCLWQKVHMDNDSIQAFDSIVDTECIIYQHNQTYNIVQRCSNLLFQGSRQQNPGCDHWCVKIQERSILYTADCQMMLGNCLISPDWYQNKKNNVYKTIPMKIEKNWYVARLRLFARANGSQTCKHFRDRVGLDLKMVSLPVTIVRSEI